MHGPINIKSPNNISEWQMGFNSAFKGLKYHKILKTKIPELRAVDIIAGVFVFILT
jgi:hypothetical protein